MANCEINNNQIIYLNFFDNSIKLSKNQIRNMIISKLKFIENVVQDNQRFLELRNEIKEKLNNNFESFSIELFKKEQDVTIEENINVDEDNDIIESNQEEIINDNVEKQEENIQGEEINEEQDDDDANDAAYDTKTYIMDSDSDGEESFIPKKKYLEKLNVSSLKNIMTNNHIKKSKNGILLKKNEMIKSIQKHLKKK
jgi:hypothetical protein